MLIFLILNYKLKNLLTELKGFKFVTTLVLDFKKYKGIKKLLAMTPFSRFQKQKQLLMRMKLIMYLNQFIIIL